MLNKIYKIGFVSAIITSPVFAFALLSQTETLAGDVKRIVSNILIPLVFTLAILLFFYGMVKYIWSEGQGKAQGKMFMIWGVVALFVMSSIWGIIYFFRVELGVKDDYNIKVPTINTSYSL